MTVSGYCSVPEVTVLNDSFTCQCSSSFEVGKDSYLVHKRVVLRGDMLKEELGKVFRI